MLKRLTFLGLAVVALAGCADENPVGIGDLVPDDAVRTYEVILDASDFLTAETVIEGFARPSAHDYTIVAEDAGGVLDAHALVRFRPWTVAYVDSAGASRSDPEPTLISGQIVARLDSALARPTEAVTLALYRTAESWDANTASWQFRVDTTGVREPWTDPGGTPGPLVSTATLEPGADSLVFAVDSATLAAWADTTDFSRGALITSQTPGARVRLDDFLLRFEARPSARPDTVVTDSATVLASTFVYDPPAEAEGRLLAGGPRGWRTYVTLLERLDTVQVTVPCDSDPAGCGYRLGDVAINYAALQLQPVAPPAGYAPADSLIIYVRSVMGGGEIPLPRAPVSNSVVGSATIAPDVLAGGDVDPVDLPITQAVRILTQDGSSDGEAGVRNPSIALFGGLAAGATGTDVDEGANFGIAAFGASTAGAAAPRLRLIFSVVNEGQVR